MEDIQNKINQLKQEQDTVEKLIQLGDLYMSKDDIVEAQHYYQKAVDLYPESAEGYCKLGELSLRNNELKVANTYFDKAADIESANAQIWLGFAKVNLLSGGNSRADEYINRAIALAPEDPNVLLYAGIIKLKNHDMFYARKYLETLLEKDEEHILPYGNFYMGLLNVQQGTFQKAMEYFGKIEDKALFTENEVNEVALKNNIALCAIRAGNNEKAEKLLEEITSIEKEDARLWINLAMVYWIQDKTEESMDALKKARSIDNQSWMWMDQMQDYLEGGKDWLKEKMTGLMEENPDGYNLVMFLGCVIPNRYPFVEAATRHVLDKLKIGVVEAEGASCCPAPGVFRSFDIDTWLVLAARNISISEAKNRDFVTMCNGCYGTLNDVNYELQHEKEKKEFVNEALKEIGKEYKGSITVRHIVDVLYNEIGLDKLKKMIVKRFDGLKVGIHYGCHILKPHYNKPWDYSSVEDPKFLDELVEITGAESIEYKDKLMCCGAGGALRTASKNVSIDITKQKLLNMREAGVDIIVDCCPFCHLQLDLGQMEVNGTFKDEIEEPFTFPVIYITQLLGLAMGMDPFKLGMLKSPKQPGTPPFIKVEPFFTEESEDLDLDV